MNKNKKAFSFIELIVVVTIIAVLSVVGVVSYGAINKKSRDSRRISDLANMRMALEAMRQIGTTYPLASGGLPVDLAPTYMEVLPKDPKSGSYFYTPLSGGYRYTIWATMEDLGSTTGSYGGGVYNYQVTNP
jgi:prepilin-type N-terminal cleavage/methylation domain-containing protein